MIDFLNNMDQQLLLFLNGFHTPWLDHVMFFISGKYEWIPFYLVLLFFIIRKYKWKSLWIILSIVVLITLSDQLANLLKGSVKRFRPCKDPEIGHLVQLVNNYCRSSYGFVSGHAANSFALATLISCLFTRKWITTGMFIWATLISCSRIYLGVHYPGDILGGALLGAMLALIIFEVLKRTLLKASNP